MFPQSFIQNYLKRATFQPKTSIMTSCRSTISTLTEGSQGDKYSGAALTRGLQRDGGLRQRRRLLLLLRRLRLRLCMRVHERGLEAVGKQAERGRLRQEPCTDGATLITCVRYMVWDVW